MSSAKDVADRSSEAFNAHDEKKMNALTAPDAKFTAPGDVSLQGREPSIGYAMAWLNAFPDARLIVRNQIVAGPWVVEEFTFEGTHTATLKAPTGDVPATNKKLAGRGVQVLRIENDMVAETNLYFDQVQMLTQLGLMPAPATA